MKLRSILFAGSLFTAPAFAGSNTAYCLQASTNLTAWSAITPVNALPPQMFFRVQFFSPPSVLPVGTVLISTNATTTMIGLTWSNNSSDTTGINIERALSTNGTWTTVGMAAGSATNFLDSGMPCCTSYWYRVDATNSAGVSPWSNIAGPAVPAYETFKQGVWQ